MDTKRGRTGEAGSESPRERSVAPDETRTNPEGTELDSPSDGKHGPEAAPSDNPQEVQDRIRDTRERMSETLNEIEYRVSPDHLKHESKAFMYDTVDELKREYHPQRIAKIVGTNMKNTVSKHPISSAIAGLSLSYLLVKSGEEKHRRTRAAGDHYPNRPPRGGYPREEPRRDHKEAGAGEQIRAATEEAAEKTQEVKEEATEQAREMKEQAEEWTEETSRHARKKARSAKHSIGRRTRRFQDQMEDFVFQNPFVVGTIALGTGALLGGMLPSTRTEDEWMGKARNDVLDRAEQATEDTVRRAGEAAENVAEEAKSAAKDVAETGKEEAERVVNEDEERGTSTQKHGGDGAEQKKESTSRTK